MRFNKRVEEIFAAIKLDETVADEVKLMYLEFEKENSLKGHNLSFIIAAFIVIVCKKRNYAMSINIFGNENSKYILKSVNFVEEKMGYGEKIEEPSAVFHDKQIESFIRKYGKSIKLNMKTIQDIIQLIPKAKFIYRTKECIAIALICFYKKDKLITKTLAKDFCISELSIKSALRELV